MSTPADAVFTRLSSRTWTPEARNLILYPRLQELLREIESCRELTKAIGEPQCISLEGETGVGKSKLVSIYSGRYPPYETETGLKLPVFKMEIPANATVKSVLQEALETLGDPAAGKGTTATMNSRFVKLLKALSVELVILDEFHELIDSETNRILAKVSEWLKMLIKQTGVAFVVVGTDGQVERILRANQQLSRLFASREKLKPFPWGTEELNRQFSKLIEFAENEVKIPISNELPRYEILYRIHYGTDGNIANVMNLIWKAAESAYARDNDSIGLSDLSYAFVKRVGKHLYKKTNPFILNVETTFTPPIESEDEDNINNPSGTKGKNRRTPMRQILSAH